MTAKPRFLLETPQMAAERRRIEPKMAHDLIANLEALIVKGGDGAALRLALAARYLDAGDAPSAVRHAEAAVRLDPEYSAAWKALGRALAAAGRSADAINVYERGVQVAEKRGDLQAAKEMRVFSKRLQQAAAKPPNDRTD
jgi:DNA-binding SARP family transcriptional activator